MAAGSDSAINAVADPPTNPIAMPWANRERPSTGRTSGPTPPTGKLIYTVIAAISCFERELMLERQREGIAKAKAEGKYRGRKPTARARAAEIAVLRADGVRPVDIARRLGIGRASVYRVLAA